MENEILQETETDLLETEEIQQTDVPINENSTVSDVGTSETSGIEDDSVLDPEETITDSGMESDTGVESDGSLDDAQAVYTQEEMEQIVAALLSGQNETVEEAEEEVRTLFNTPLQEYSVSEGLLLIVLLLILSAFVNSVFKGSRFMSKLR